VTGNPFNPLSFPASGVGRVTGGVGRGDTGALATLLPEIVWRVWGAQYGGGEDAGDGVGGSGLPVGLGWGVSGGVFQGGRGRGRLPGAGGAEGGGSQGVDGDDDDRVAQHLHTRLVSQSPALILKSPLYGSLI
jgi:hypothetical protein